MAAEYAQPWLLLQFEVLCCDPLVVNCSDTTPLPWQAHCPDSDVVLLVLDTTLTKATLYFLEDGSIASEPQQTAVSVYLDTGSACVNSMTFASEQEQTEVLCRLRCSVELQQLSSPSPFRTCGTARGVC